MMWRGTSVNKYRPIKMPKLMTTICGSWHCKLPIFDDIKNLDIRSHLRLQCRWATFHPIGSEVKLAFGWWKGARPAVFSFNTDATAKTNGWVDVDWVYYQALATGPSRDQ